MLGIFAFYLFAAILVLSSLMVISARNPVHSVLFLILALFNAAGLFVLLGAEFVAMILVIVYVGAVAVLFLFVVMMLDINFAELRKGALQFVPLGLSLGAVILGELTMLFISAPPHVPNVAITSAVDNTKALGQVLYTSYVFPFQVSGLILLVAMIGAIVLTLRTRSGVLRQNVATQVNRQPSEVISLAKVVSGVGVDDV